MEKKKITAIKGFDQNWKCRDFQFEVGKTYKHNRPIRVCDSGFHAVEYPLDVFIHYDPANSKYAIVELSGEIDTQEQDSKIAASRIAIKEEIDIYGIAKRAVDWIISKATRVESATETRSVAINTEYQNAATNIGKHSAAISTKDRSAATNTGTRSVAANTGDWSTAANTEYRSIAANTGDWSAAINTGPQSVASSTGVESAAVNAGNHSVAVNIGYRSASINTGYQSIAINTGDESAATNSGGWSVATNTGCRSTATNTGDKSASVNTGDESVAEVSGKGSVALNVGYQGKAKASKGCAIVLCYYDNNGDLIHIRASKVGENGIKPDTCYWLNSKGEFVEANDD